MCAGLADGLPLPIMLSAEFKKPTLLPAAMELAAAPTASKASAEPGELTRVVGGWLLGARQTWSCGCVCSPSVQSEPGGWYVCLQ